MASPVYLIEEQFYLFENLASNVQDVTFQVQGLASDVQGLYLKISSYQDLLFAVVFACILVVFYVGVKLWK